MSTDDRERRRQWHQVDWRDRRQPLNDAARGHAGHHYQPWLSHEDDLLQSLVPTEEELVIAAELLGRTVEACRTRLYDVRRNGRTYQPNAAHPRAAIIQPHCSICGLQHRGDC